MSPLLSNTTDEPAAGLVITVQRAAAKASRLLGHAVLGLSAIVLVGLVVVLFLQVLFRYVLQQPLAWTEESARFALVWLSMLAAVAAAREGQQFLFRWLTIRLPAAARFWVRRFCDLLTMVLLVTVFWESLIYLQVVSNQTAAGTGVNMQVPYAGVTVGAALLFVIYALDNIDGLLSRFTGVTYSLRELNENEVHRMFQAPDLPPQEPR